MLSGATTIGAVFDRINSIVAGQGYVRAKDAFSFDLQPRQELEKCYYVETSLDNVQGYCGMAQMELHRIKIWVARRIRRDPHGAYRSLVSDLDLLESPLYLDYPGFGYHVADESVSKEVPTPAEGWLFAVGRLEFLADIDRDLR